MRLINEVEPSSCMTTDNVNVYNFFIGKTSFRLCIAGIEVHQKVIWIKIMSLFSSIP